MRLYKDVSKKGKPFLRGQSLIVVVTFAAVAVVVFLGNQVNREARKMAIEQFNKQQLILAHSAASGIETYFNGVESELAAMAKVPGVKQMTLECLESLEHAYSVFPQKTSTRLLDSNGVLRFIYPYDDWRKELIGIDYSEERYFREAKETGRIAISRLINNENGDQRIRIAIPIYLANKTKAEGVAVKDDRIAAHTDPNAQESNKFQGVLIGSVDPNTIAEHFIWPIVSGKTGYAWLVNQHYNFLAHHEEEFLGLNAFAARAAKDRDLSYEAIGQIQKKMLAGEEGVGRYISGWHRKQKGKIEKLVAYAPVNVSGKLWSVAVCAPLTEVEEIEHMVRRSEHYTLAFIILLLTTGGFLFFIISFRWSRSLELEVARQTKELRETGEYLNSLIRHTNAPIIVWNSDRQITIFNKAFEKMIGRIESEMMVLPPDLMFPVESRSDCMKRMESAFTGDNWETMEMPILCKDGEVRIGLWNSANIYDEDGKTVIATIAQGQDITERVGLKEEKKRMEARLQQAQKMTAMGTLAGGIAHDFNNLLMAIQGRTSIMLMNKASSHPDFEHLTGIEDNIESAADLTRQLLGFARGGKYEVRPTDLNELIKKQNRMFGRTKKEITIRGKYEKDLWSVEVDRGQIKQVLLNLYVNAWQAMPGNGNLYLETGNVTLDETDVKPFSVEPGRYVKISVTDTGVGMDKATRERIFDPFFTTKEMGKGTGLGLASVYGIIKNHGGFINVYSEEGHGTTFNIYLPASEKAVIEEKRPAGDTLRGSETVLFIDDEDMIIEIAEELFEQLGYKVLTARSGKEAIKTYKESKERIDIVLLDMIMPDMSGGDTYDRMKDINPKVKVLLSSGYSINSQATEILDRGCNGFIQKPFKMKELSQKLREILDGK